MLLECGAPRGSKLYWAAVTVVCLGVTGWFLWDWKWGWINANLDEARKQLGLTADQPLTTSGDFSEADFKNLLASGPKGRQQMQDALGKPVGEPESRPDAVAERFVSPYGVVTVTSRDGLIVTNGLSWQGLKHTKGEIEAQLWFACVPLAAALWGLSKWVKTALRRVRMDEQGLDYAGLRIAYGDMRGFSNFSRKGWVDLNHVEGGTPRKLRLDNQRVEKFEQIIDVVCQKTGAKNPNQADDADRGK